MIKFALIGRWIAALTFSTAVSSEAPAPTPPTDPPDPIGVVRSEPAANATVVAPLTEIRIWFSEVPQDSIPRVRLVDLLRHVRPIGELQQDPDDPTLFFAAVPAGLQPGKYFVRWRATGADGVEVENLYGFTLSAVLGPDGDR